MNHARDGVLSAPRYAARAGGRNPEAMAAFPEGPLRKEVAMRLSRLALPLLLLPALAQARETGDPAAGQRVFSQCSACHTIGPGESAGIGPNLHGVFGRQAASAPGYRYSQNLQELGQQGHSWNEETLRPYLRNPREVTPRGTMNFLGLRDDAQIEDVIAYLRQRSG